MRHLITIALFATLVAASASPNRMNDLNDLRTSLKNIGSDYAAGRKADAALALAELSERHYPIDWIREVPSDSWAAPTQERLERINEISQAIAGSESVLVEMAFDRELNGMAHSSARKFLYYAPPSNQLKTTLLSKADVSSEAYLLLFETGLFDSDVRAKYVEGLQAPAPSSLRIQRADMAVEWGLLEALPVYLEMLQRPFDPSTISFVGHIPAEDAKSSLSRYKVAAQAAMHFGPSGVTLLPLLNQRFAEIQAAFPDNHQALTGTLKAAIDVIEGRRNPPIRAAMNGRGALNLMLGASPVALASDEATQAMPATRSKQMMPSSTPTKATQQPSAIDQAEPSKSTPWPWIIGAILLLAVAGGILLKLRRK